MIYIQAVGVLNAIGSTPAAVRSGLLEGASAGMRVEADWLHDGRPVMVGKIDAELPPVPEGLREFDCRNNRLLLAALEQVRPKLEEALTRHGRHRVGIVMGTSTAGLPEGERAAFVHAREHRFPAVFHYCQQEMGSPSEFLATVLRTTGPAFTISTACSSTGRAFVSARRLIAAGLCDVVLVGGADTLCRFTLNGFHSLEALARGRSNPFSRNRDGINIGEGVGLMLVGREPGPVALKGMGESSDAYHTSSPHPEGEGAEAAMRMALEDAGLGPEEIGYVNLHGTGTELNDIMEARAAQRVFGCDLPCSSTKPLTGHTLGAAAITEAALCWALLTQPGAVRIPPQLWDGVADPALPPIGIVREPATAARPNLLSNSFAFGGNNVSLILGRTDAG